MAAILSRPQCVKVSDYADMIATGVAYYIFCGNGIGSIDLYRMVYHVEDLSLWLNMSAKGASMWSSPEYQSIYTSMVVRHGCDIFKAVDNV